MSDKCLTVFGILLYVPMQAFAKATQIQPGTWLDKYNGSQQTHTCVASANQWSDGRCILLRPAHPFELNDAFAGVKTQLPSYFVQACQITNQHTSQRLGHLCV